MREDSPVNTQGKSRPFKIYKIKDFFFIFWPHAVACRILFPQPRIEPVPLAVEAQSPNHWTAREFPKIKDLKTRKLRLSKFKWLAQVYISGRSG